MIYLFFIFVILLFINATLVAFQFALLGLRYKSVEISVYNTMVKEFPQLESLLEKAHQLARIIRFCTSVITLAYGILFYPLLVRFWQLQTGTLFHWFWQFFVFILLFYLFYFITEVLPRGWALRNPLMALRRTSVVVKLVEILTAPFRKVFRLLTGSINKVFKIKDPSQDYSLLDIEIHTRALGDDGDMILSKQLREIVRNTLKIRDLTVSDIMLPRSQVQYLDTFQTLEESLEQAQKFGHTRYPLCDGELDKAVGLVHIKDLFRAQNQGNLKDLVALKRKIERFRESDPLELVLQKMLHNQWHMAIVEDEFNGVAGVITLEQILEEMVGEIQDEFDREEKCIEEIDPGVYRVDGRTSLHDLPKIFSETLELEGVSTIGGLIIMELGRIPKEGEFISSKNFSAVIEKATPKYIVSVTLTVAK